METRQAMPLDRGADSCRKVLALEKCGLHPIAQPSEATETLRKLAPIQLQLERNIDGEKKSSFLPERVRDVPDITG